MQRRQLVKAILTETTVTKLRRLYATVMQSVDEVNEELQLRAAADNAGDTVKVPISSAVE